MFPISTYFGKKIAKQKFYDNLSVSSALKRFFIDEIFAIYWEHKLCAQTLNIPQGNAVVEIEVLQILMYNKDFDAKVFTDALMLMDKKIPYHLLYVLKYDENIAQKPSKNYNNACKTVSNEAQSQAQYQLWIAYKEESHNNNFSVKSYYHTEWCLYEELSINIAGLNLDKVYENFIKQIAQNTLKPQQGESIKDTVFRAQQKAKLEKKINALQTKICKEKQFNKQVELNGDLKRLKEEFETLL